MRLLLSLIACLCLVSLADAGNHGFDPFAQQVQYRQRVIVQPQVNGCGYDPFAQQIRVQQFAVPQYQQRFVVPQVQYQQQIIRQRVKPQRVIIQQRRGLFGGRSRVIFR